MQSELWAARTFIVTHDRPASSAPQLVAPAGPHTAASAGVDPASDRALIAWLSGGARPRIEYASGPANGRYRPRATPAVRAAHAGTHWLRITLAAVGGLALAAVAVLVALRARGRSRTRAGR